ncbi:hypothetical protein ACIRPQ_29050 [Streptomyces sp. NPDC101213]|uniref:hypothetical protein n=1 Tax=Streptomyces sp. NPDC101213 TaxID=3366130 RepID=UPI00381E3F31
MPDEPSIPAPRSAHPSLQHSKDRVIYVEPDWTPRDVLLVVGGITLCLCILIGWMSFLAATVLEPVLLLGAL